MTPSLHSVDHISIMAPALDNLLELTASAKSIVDLRLIITGLIQNHKETHQNCKRQSKTLQDKITELRQEKAELERSVEDHEATIADLQAKVFAAQDERKELSTKIGNPSTGKESTPPDLQELHDALDNTNQYARRGAFTLNAKDNEIPVFSEGECSKTIVIEKILRHTGIKLEETDISIAHRLGRKPDNPDADRRGIRFRLVRRDLGPRIVAACKDKRPPIFVNPSLTPTRAKIFHELRRLKSGHQQIKSCRATLNGDIEAYCKDSAGSGRLKKYLVNTKSQLDKFASDVLKAAEGLSAPPPLTGGNIGPLSPKFG